MRLYFKTRQAARLAIPAGKLVDLGTAAPSGKRYARDISGLSKLTRKALVQNNQAIVAQVHGVAL